MRRLALAPVLIAACLPLAPAPAGAQSAQPQNGQLLTPGQDSSQNLTSTAQTPLNDFNVRRQKIPPILLAAIADPYAPLGRLTCKTLSDEIGRLYVALGRDFDDPLPPSPAGTKGATQPGGGGLRLAHSAVQAFIPYDGFVRYLSGAQKRDELVNQAINAGNARRAYLKGLGESRGCANPASPRGHGRGAPKPVQFW